MSLLCCRGTRASVEVDADDHRGRRGKRWGRRETREARQQRLGADRDGAENKQVQLGTHGAFTAKDKRGQASWNLPSKGRKHPATS